AGEAAFSVIDHINPPRSAMRWDAVGMRIPDAGVIEMTGYSNIARLKLPVRTCRPHYRILG
ncbi:MAG TPA: hypothetical protein VLT81_03755, partial [Chondromyces sp.]|nr:hypothetical protein [Chondromyces sp.]